jgi:hypothetical protein
MKKLFAFVFSLASVAAFAQLTSANHTPTNGDQYKMHMCDSTNISPGAAGSNVTWNFSSLNTHTSSVRTFDVASISGNTTYPNAALTISSTVDDPAYYSASSSSFMFHGGQIAIGTVKGSLAYSSPAIYMSYPLAMGNSSTVATAGSVFVTAPAPPAPANGTFVGTSKVEADGTGTLVLPSSVTYTNVMRVMTTQTINFNVMVQGTILQTIYDYYSAGTKYPILSITVYSLNSAFGSGTSTVVLRNKESVFTPSVPTTTTAIVQQDAVVLRAYPNPSSSMINISVENNFSGTISVFDLTGRVVMKEQISSANSSINVSGLNNGLYIFQLKDRSDHVAGSGKFTVSR